MTHQKNGVYQENGEPEHAATAGVSKCTITGYGVQVLEKHKKAAQKWKMPEIFLFFLHVPHALKTVPLL